MRLFRWGIDPKGRETTLAMSPGCCVVAAHCGLGPCGKWWLGITVLDPCVEPHVEYTFRTFEEDGEPIPDGWTYVIAATSKYGNFYVFEKAPDGERELAVHRDFP